MWMRTSLTTEKCRGISPCGTWTGRATLPILFLPTNGESRRGPYWIDVNTEADNVIWPSSVPLPFFLAILAVRYCFLAGRQCMFLEARDWRCDRVGGSAKMPLWRRPVLAGFRPRKTAVPTWGDS